MRTLIKGGNIIIGNSSTIADLLIEDDKIIEIGRINVKADKVIEADGLTIIPGLVDMHVHLREPGFEYKETILSGTKAAVKGGFTAVACMPNTSPVCDSEAVVALIKAKAAEANYAKVYPIGAITKESKGLELAEMYKMKKAGIVAASDDGKPVSNGNIMRHAMEYAKTIDLLLISHCEDIELAAGGLVNEGYNSTISGLSGITRVSEEIMVAREIFLAEALKTKIHLAHLSTRGSIELVRQAKARGVKVTAETCPHYFAANDDLILSFNSNTKVNPPLRTEDDRQEVIKGIADGTIDAIVTDHAPHHQDDKRVEYALAANGISGLETSFALGYTYLVKTGVITLYKLIELMSINPAKIIGIISGINVGGIADITIVNTEDKYIIDSSKFISKGKNTPFNGFEVYGSVQYTIVNGRLLVDKGQVL